MWDDATQYAVVWNVLGLGEVECEINESLSEQTTKENVEENQNSTQLLI